MSVGELVIVPVLFERGKDRIALTDAGSGIVRVSLTRSLGLDQVLDCLKSAFTFESHDALPFYLFTRHQQTSARVTDNRQNEDQRVYSQGMHQLRESDSTVVTRASTNITATRLAGLAVVVWTHSQIANCR